MNNGNQSSFKNTLAAIVLSVTVLLAWDHFMVPKVDPAAVQQQAQDQTAPDTDIPVASSEISNVQNNDILPSGGFENLDVALPQAQRLQIQNEKLVGSLNLETGRFDDLLLSNYTTELNADAAQQENIRLFAPSNTESGFFADFGYNVGTTPLSKFEGAWKADVSALSNTQSVTLTKQAGDLTIERKISLDEDYMFTVTDTLKNNSSDAVSVTPYAF